MAIGAGDRVTTRYTIEIIVDGVTVAGEELAKLLEAVALEGSLNRAARRIGIPYSRAWDLVARAERIIGQPLLVRSKGGSRRGGASLTGLGLEIVEAYRSARRKLEQALGPVEAPRRQETEAQLVVAHSSDPLLEVVLQRLRDSGVVVDSVCTGSGLALAMLSLGEADAACMHLYDPASGSYNLPFLRQGWVEDPQLLGGYERQLVFAVSPGLEARGLSLQDLLEAVRRGELAVVQRNRGSGTQLLLEHLLSGAKPLRSVGPAYTHEEAARLVASGKAQLALVARAAAERYGLPFIHAAWERYECYAPRSRLDAAEPLSDALGSDWVMQLIKSHPGYRPFSGST